MKKSRSITSKLPAALALVGVAALWCFASEGGWVPAFMLPSPRAVVQALLSDAPVLAANAAVTLQALEAEGYRWPLPRPDRELAQLCQKRGESR